MKFLYLFINFGAFIVPLIFSFHPKIQFYKRWKFALPAIFITALIFILWDIYFTQIKVWGFNPDYLTGIYFFNLPLEEVLFFICIPYSCLFTYHCFTLFINPVIFKTIENKITFSLLIFLSVFAILFYDRLYTTVTFISLSTLLVVLFFVFKVNFFHRFYFTFLILLIPFLIVNGILTGTGIEQPVVWYNNFEITRFRILTIPFEDVFYGMLLQLLNVSLFELFSRKAHA